MNSARSRIARFVVGFGIVAVTCALVLKHNVWKEQLVLLLVFSTVAGLIGAFSDRALLAMLRYWTF